MDESRCKKGNPDKEDRLSKLPDVLVLHIFSFLSMKDTMKTSVLSSRWEYLWMSISNLKFDDGCHRNPSKFVPFVDRTMSCCRSTIKQFSLRSSWNIDPLHVKRWITTAVRCNVEDLCIHVYGGLGYSLNFPRCLCASQILTKLNLNVCWNVKFPPLICLSSLKHLYLGNIIFPDNESTNRFLSGCPALETMSLTECYWHHVQRVCICATKLWKLKIYEKSTPQFMQDLYTCEVVIAGPSLKYFYYEGVFFNDYILHDVPSFIESSIEFKCDCDENVPRVVFSRLYKILNCLSKAKTLSLSSDVLLALQYAADLLLCVPLFKYLSILSFTRWNIELDRVALTKLLQNSPHHEILWFETGITFSGEYKKDEILEPVPPCFPSSLKRIEICVYLTHGNQKHSVDAVEILLKRATALEKMILYFFKELHANRDAVLVWMEKEKLAKEELMQLPIVSKVCKLEFSNSRMKSTTPEKYEVV